MARCGYLQEGCRAAQARGDAVGVVACFQLAVTVTSAYRTGIVQRKLASMPQEWWQPEAQAKVSATIGGREQNIMETKPGVNTINLIFSTRNYDRIWELPLFRYFKPELERALAAVIGPDAFSHIVRAQLAQMAAGSHIRKHRDAGPWAQECAPLLQRRGLIRNKQL